ncbi:metalloregulator ArsR/SmtB family transcription factor [Desulfosporosinus sp. OT]|uniref:ArsR/SmtB family transcription factor n=1 Tax=Desulfosporosinus sp. OT TaxID=913865 RepID=UPI000223B1CB|nr:metalloregulator ArsR/SmtB family transcription factor [Desulfosporosinus sp. OT]EGW41037.1 bacterial regulatory, arsR family protein [Desulfosporosinus sp. OT]
MPQELPTIRRLLGIDEIRIRQEAKRYKALGDETRLKIFRVLEKGERCVCELMDLFQMNQSAASHQLKVLENAGLVEGRRVGKFVYYCVPEDRTEEL